ncbi:MAG: hypothetical protein HZC48_03690 [Nitrospirae bacterium]|nr:hypothetical protein [Nitrospirota bacterium]
MQIKDYVTSVLDVISSCPFIESQNLSFEERPPNAAYLTGIIVFINGSKMHFKEFIVLKPEGVNVLKYGYSYLRINDSLIFRYDNALDPKAKKLSTYPEHKHLPTELLPAPRPSLGDILREVSFLIEQNKEL